MVRQRTFGIVEAELLQSGCRLDALSVAIEQPQKLKTCFSDCH